MLVLKLKVKLKSKTTLYSLLVLLWLGLIAGFLIYPLWNNVESKSEQLQQKQNKIAEVKMQSRQLNSLQQSLEKQEKKFKILDNLFINKEAPVQFLEFLEKTAAISNIEIDISPSAGQKNDEPWPPTFFEVRGVGQFEGCIKFMTKLEQAPYLLEIQDISIQKTTEEGKEEETNINLLIKVY